VADAQIYKALASLVERGVLLLPEPRPTPPPAGKAKKR